MRSKYEVSHDARVANANPTLEAYGVSFELNRQFFEPNYTAKVDDDELVALWPRLSNEAFPGLASINTATAGGVHFFRNEGRKGSQDVPYTVLTIYAQRAAELLANGAVEGEKLQPAIAG